MTRFRAVATAALVLVGSALAAADGRAPVNVPSFAYHLRVVRVSAHGALPGAAIGWGQNGGAPVVVPSEEAWGKPDQLQALASLLGGDRADAVTGFYAVAGQDGVLRFERKVYLGESVLDLRFHAVPPATRDGAHEVGLRLAREGSVEPLAEAKVVLATNRTVAIAVPGAVAGDWVVLGATPLAPVEAAERIRAASAFATLDSPGVAPPRLVRSVAPEYPAAAKQEGRTGKIVLQVLLDTDGVPRASQVISMSPGMEDLAGAAVDAVEQWRYSPATRDGKPVAVWYYIVVQFRLE